MPGSSLLISLDSGIRQNHDLFRVTLGTLRVVSDAGQHQQPRKMDITNLHSALELPYQELVTTQGTLCPKML